ncbi:DUF1093 domain-containing protein [Lacticaseibacillus songhuajiangensis]|uniref:DUF1093 domain-containing protein n=1 Tax=Lacticaseibacillus songhuajiangensis TaxID=1296539 RepID=UPI000F7A3C9E|nr:DUF1093 domain-containing protein [Lacticaseibacillus songhuajiangensis]
MKKVLGIIAVVLLVVIGWVGYKEWSSTYKTTEAYALVPATPAKTRTVNNEGKKQSDGNGNPLYSYKYTFKFVTTDGQTRTLRWEQEGTNPTPLTPGAYVYAKISQKRVNNGLNIVSADKVPSSIKAKLK